MVVHDCVLLLCYVCVLCLCEHATCVRGYTLMSTCGTVLWVCCVEWMLCRHLWIVSVSSLVVATTRSWQEQPEEGRVQSGSQFGVLSSWCESSHSRIWSRLSHCIHCQKLERWTPLCQSLSPFSSVQSSSFWMVAPTLRTGLPTSALNLENVLQTCLELCFPDDSRW